MNSFRRQIVFNQISSSITVTPRPGLTVLEAIGALAAVSAGLWLGAKYLEIDLREAWNLAAGKTGFVQFETESDEAQTEAIDEETDPLDDADLGQSQPESPQKTARDNPAAHGEVHDEIERLRHALKRLEGSQKTGLEPAKSGDGRGERATPSNLVRDDVSSKNVVGKRTLAYWNQLNQIMLKEEQLRQAPSSGLTGENAGEYMVARGKASRFAAKAMRKLATRNVDPIVTVLARDIADWYERGAQLNDQAIHLFTKANPASRRGPLGQSWSTAEKQHQNEVQLINRRGDAVRQQMINTYGLAFPDLR